MVEVGRAVTVVVTLVDLAVQAKICHRDLVRALEVVRITPAVAASKRSVHYRIHAVDLDGLQVKQCRKLG